MSHYDDTAPRPRISALSRGIRFDAKQKTTGCGKNPPGERPTVAYP